MIFLDVQSDPRCSVFRPSPYNQVALLAQILKLNPNRIGVKYSLVVWGGGGGYFYHVSGLTSLLVKKYVFFLLKFCIETLGNFHD